MTLPAKADAAMGGPPAYRAAETAPQPPATIVNVPTASAAHLAASEYVGLSSAMVYLFVRRVDGVDADGTQPNLCCWLYGCQICTRPLEMDKKR